MMPAEFGAEKAVIDEMGKTMRFVKFFIFNHVNPNDRNFSYFGSAK